MADDSTVVDPSGHRIALDNEHVRIVEVRVSEGANLSMHSHPPRAIVAIGAYRLESTDETGPLASRIRFRSAGDGKGESYPPRSSRSE